MITLILKNGNLRDYLFAAGGVNDEEHMKKMYVKRVDIIRKSNDGYDKKFIKSLDLSEEILE